MKNVPQKDWDFDKLNRKPFAEKLTLALSRWYKFTPEALVLSLNAPFGAGKTTFLDMWRTDLERKGHKVISLNAWETDFDEEPLIPIISALIEVIDEKNAGKKLKAAAQGALGAVALMANEALAHCTGINVKNTAYQVEKDIKENDLKEFGKALYKEYSFKKKAYAGLKSALIEYVEKLENGPLFVFVDELDRVRPNYAVAFLEAIKHIFSVQGICFVLAVNRAQIEQSVRHLYGNIDFENYYRRFVSKEIDMPEISGENLDAFIVAQYEIYFNEDTNNEIYFPGQNGKITPGNIEILKEVCKSCNFTAREIQSYISIYAQFLSVESHKKQGLIVAENWNTAAMLFLSIYIKDRDLYYKIGNESVSVDDKINYIKSLSFSRDPNGDIIHAGKWIKDKFHSYFKKENDGFRHSLTLFFSVFKKFYKWESLIDQ
jgi:hypothetical protein